MKKSIVLSVFLVVSVLLTTGLMASTATPTESATENPTSGPTLSPTDSISTESPTNTATNTQTMTPSATVTPTQGAPLTVPLLTASHSGTNTTLSWPTNGSVTSYSIYRSNGAAGKFTPLSGWTVVDTIAPSAGTTSYIIADEANNTYNTYSYFVVTGTDGSIVTAASNIATRINFYFLFTAGGKNVDKPSLPYVSKYAFVKDITDELTSSKVDKIGKFVAVNQTYQLYQYNPPWVGTSWANDAGTSASNAFLMHLTSSFNWVVAGTDNNPSLTFTANPVKASSNVRQMPYSGIYKTASDIVTDIEGGTGPGTNTKISKIAIWNPATQTYQLYQYNGTSTWLGTNFNVLPGATVNFYVSSGVSFTWTPQTVVK